MTNDEDYPGSNASPSDVADLADQYRWAAETLLGGVSPRKSASRAPYRFVAVHAVELYLNAYLLHAGLPLTKVRGLQHDLAQRTELALGAKLTLRKRTAEHLRRLSEAREYLKTRYDPTAIPCSELNRLQATLTEVSQKVRRTVDVGPH